MVGGRWWGCQRLAHKEIPLEEHIPDTAHYDAVLAYFIDKGWGDTYAYVEVEAYFNVGSDESVGLPEICDLHKSFIPDGFENDVAECPFLSKHESDALFASVCEAAEDEDGYELYDID